jgi:integrase
LVALVAQCRQAGLLGRVQERQGVGTWEDRPALAHGRRNVTLLPQIVDTMLGTGLRIGECLALREADLDLDAAARRSP